MHNMRFNLEPVRRPAKTIDAYSSGRTALNLHARRLAVKQYVAEKKAPVPGCWVAGHRGSNIRPRPPYSGHFQTTGLAVSILAAKPPCDKGADSLYSTYQLSGRQSRKNVASEVKTHRIVYMEKAEIKQMADYIKDLEEGLVGLDYRGLSTLGHLTKLPQIIERLMEATSEVNT